MSLVKANLVEQLITAHHLTREQAQEAVRVIFEAMKATLAAGGRIELRGFGVFEVRPRKRGLGRNPKTGEEVPIAPGRAVRFKPSRALHQS